MKKNIAGSIMFLLLFVANVLYAQPEKKRLPHKENRFLKDVKSKEITAEFPCNSIATVFLENMLRGVSIRTTNELKVRLVTTVYYQGDPSYTDAEWLQLLHLSIGGNPGNVVIRSNMPGRQATQKTPPSKPGRPAPDTMIANGVAVFDSSGRWVNRKSDIRRNLVLYIPAGANLDIESKYSDISLENDVNELKLRLTNGGCTMMNAKKMTVIGVYSNIYAGNIDKADIEMTSGRYRAKNITALNINSKNSAVELENVRQAKMVSESDQYEIEDAGEIVATKNYGDLRITSLRLLLDLTGVNADVKLRSIDPNVRLIKIDDQYADLRLPVSNLKDYAVGFEGSGSNIYAPFEKPNAPGVPFNITVGAGNTTSFRLKCSNCTLDFK